MSWRQIHGGHVRGGGKRPEGQGKAAGGGGRVRLGPRCGSVQLQPSRFPRTPPGPGVGAGRGGHSPQAPGAPRHLGTLWVQWGQHRPAERGTGLLGPVSAPHGPPDPTYWPAASTPPCARALRGLPHERPSPGLSQPPASGQEASAVLLPTTATPLRLHPAPGCHRGWGVGWEWAVPSGVRVWSNPGTPPPPLQSQLPPARPGPLPHLSSSDTRRLAACGLAGAGASRPGAGSCVGVWSNRLGAAGQQGRGHSVGSTIRRPLGSCLRGQKRDLQRGQPAPW